MTFGTHTGAIVQGAQLEAALQAVADWYAANARGVRSEDLYASHVTTAQKDEYLARGLAHAEQVRRGEVSSFAVWQRINTHLTGECVAFPAEMTTS